MIDVVVGGDFVPSGPMDAYLRRGELDSVFHDSLPIFKNSDIAVVNLESPLVSGFSPIVKEGPFLHSHPDTVRYLKEAGIDAVTLANNHVMDHGQEGLTSTIKSLESSHIRHFGVGNNLNDAWEPYIKRVGNKRIAFLGLAEHEFSIATEHKAGACPVDLIDYVRLTRGRKNNEWDYLIVLLHGGNEYWQLPSPRLQKTCRFLIEQGADSVICQHTHVPGSHEVYLDKPIVYGQGNLLFDSHNPPCPAWNRGFFVKIGISETTINADFIPYRQDENGVALLTGSEREDFLSAMEARSEVVCDPTRLANEWNKFCESIKPVAYRRLFLPFPNNRYVKAVATKLRFFERLTLSKKRSAILLNSMRCESHRDVITRILERNIESDGTNA